MSRPQEKITTKLTQAQKSDPRRERYNGHMELVGRYFDENAQDWSDLYQSTHRVNDLVLANRKDIAVAFLRTHLSAGSRILDAGCGAGLVALDLVSTGFFVHGVDVSERMLALCEERFAASKIPSSQYIFTLADIVESPLPDESFDGIVALGFMQYQADEAQALKALHRVLRPGGVLVISGPVRVKISNWFCLPSYYWSIKNRSSRLIFRVAPGSRWALTHGSKQPSSTQTVLQQISRHSYSVGRFGTLLQGAGFDMMDYKGHGFVNYTVIGHRIGFKGELLLHRFFTRLSDFLPIGRWANDLVVIAKKKQ